MTLQFGFEFASAEVFETANIAAERTGRGLLVGGRVRFSLDGEMVLGSIVEKSADRVDVALDFTNEFGKPVRYRCYANSVQAV